MKNMVQDLRQIPCSQYYTTNKKYNDLLYGILQEQSYRFNGIRYVDKPNFKSLGEKMAKSNGKKAMTRQTASKYFKELIDLGLLTEDNKRYILTQLDEKARYLIPIETLRVINNGLSRYAVSIYIYLWQIYYAKKEQFTIDISTVKKYIGIASSTTSNNNVVTDILYILQRIGLVKWHYFNETKACTKVYIDVVRLQLIRKDD